MVMWMSSNTGAVEGGREGRREGERRSSRGGAQRGRDAWNDRKHSLQGETEGAWPGAHRWTRRCAGWKAKIWFDGATWQTVRPRFALALLSNCPCCFPVGHPGGKANIQMRVACRVELALSPNTDVLDSPAAGTFTQHRRARFSSTGCRHASTLTQVRLMAGLGQK